MKAMRRLLKDEKNHLKTHSLVSIGIFAFMKFSPILVFLSFLPSSWVLILALYRFESWRVPYFEEEDA